MQDFCPFCGSDKTDIKLTGAGTCLDCGAKCDQWARRAIPNASELVCHAATATDDGGVVINGVFIGLLLDGEHIGAMLMRIEEAEDLRERLNGQITDAKLGVGPFLPKVGERMN